MHVEKSKSVRCRFYTLLMLHFNKTNVNAYLTFRLYQMNTFVKSDDNKNVQLFSNIKIRTGNFFYFSFHVGTRQNKS